ncbi:unnamed protein product, partial [Meganyctiphanes norvegica]
YSVHTSGGGRGSRRWWKYTLVITESQTSDNGLYRCQVAARTPAFIDTVLAVIEPRASVVDERGKKVVEKHYKEGSMIELLCLVDRIPFPHQEVVWTRTEEVLVFNNSRGGISVRGEPKRGTVTSRLYVANVSPSDSGIYACVYGNGSTQ